MSRKLYPEYKQLDLPGIARQILEQWEKDNTFGKSIELREGCPDFTFYEGPPSANGLPGIHHVMARTIKDIFCRYKTIQGYRVKRKGGWDTHGLPIELSVEKTLGITKEDIGKKITVEEYNKACRSEVMKYKNVWDDLTRKMGYWVDLENPYITFDNSYIECCWFLLSKLYDKGLLYKGYTIQPYSPAAGTGLSSHELNMPGAYRMIKDTSVVAMFKIRRNEKSEWLFQNAKSDIFFLAWTTTPWTLPANCALAVGKNIDYALIETVNPYSAAPVTVVLAVDLIPKFFQPQNENALTEGFKAGDKNLPWKKLATIKGSELIGIKYEQLLPYVQPKGKAFEVIAGDFVTTDDGTGVVHTASVFGADDFRVCNENGIASIMVEGEDGKPSPLVDKRGRFVNQVTDFAGEYVKEEFYTEAEKEEERKKQGGPKYLSTDERIAIKLKKEGKAFKVEKYEHSYPHCWRTDKPVLYYPLDSWFIKTTAFKERMVALNKTINWKPESTGTGRFGNWLENLVDWNLSRSRFWGIPLPVWRTEDGKEEICIGSIEQLYDEIEKSVAAGFMKSNPLPQDSKSNPDGALKNSAFDLHRPYIDEVFLVSPSGKKMIRENDLIDVWFDSGAMPYAQWGLDHQKLKEGHDRPFKKDFDTAYPADFIAEGVDQTRGWFFTLHAIAVMLFDSVAFNNVVSNGLVLDKNGNKMSKRLGNAVDPFKTISQYGPDATRWYMISNAPPWDNLKFNTDGITEVQRKFFGTLFNTYSFFALYANIDGFKINEQDVVPVSERAELDRWILSKLYSLVKVVTSAYEAYEPTQAVRAIEEFVDEHLSNWYVRLSRRRFWKGEMSKDKKAAYETLYECLMVIAQLSSPVAPFFSDWLYKNLSDQIRPEAVKNNTPLRFDSVHLTLLTKVNENLIDASLEERMALAQKISSMVLSLRKRVNIRVRQPLSRILIPVMESSLKPKIDSVKDIILSEVNIKSIEYIHNTEGILTKKIKPDFKALGKKLGAKMKEAAKVISEMNQQQIAGFEIEKSFTYQSADGSSVTLSIDEVEILTDDMPGWAVNSEGNLTVALDTAISPELRNEGLARELINRVQNLRKDMGFEVTDRIKVRLKNHESLTHAVRANLDYICAEILAGSFEMDDQLNPPAATEIEVEDNIKTLIKIERI
jgi:isoleucyl-tRNA synthetase